MFKKKKSEYKKAQLDDEYDDEEGSLDRDEDEDSDDFEDSEELEEEEETPKTKKKTKKKELYRVAEVPTQTARVVYNTKTGESMDTTTALVRILNILEDK